MKVPFTALGLRPQLIDTILDLGFAEPTPIQAATIPLLLKGSDCIAQAQTGTGKTAAFGLPLLQRLQRGDQGVQALILAPTRELAGQVCEALRAYAGQQEASILQVCGGHAYQEQIRGLRSRTDIVVGTPGRIIDLLDKGLLRLDRLQTLVLDEADEMLSMGFIEDIERILAQTPDNRQTVLFSATISPRVRELAHRYCNDAESVRIAAKQLTGNSIEQRYYLVNAQDKGAALARLLEVETISSALIFTRTRSTTAELASQLSGRGFPAESLSGDLSQEARTQALNRFRQGETQIMVATDVAARGLDIADLSHVINFDLPEDPEVYVHRIGRTGRAGREGLALTLVTPRERWRLKKIESITRCRLAQSELPSEAAIEQHRRDRLLAQIEMWIRRERCHKERELVDLLISSGHSPEEVATAALKMARAEEKKRPIPAISAISQETRPRTKGTTDRRKGRVDQRPTGRPERGMIPLSLNIGRSSGVAVNHVVSALAHFSGIAGSSLGRIRIGADTTLVDVPEPLANQVLAKSGSYRIKRRPVSVQRI